STSNAQPDCKKRRLVIDEYCFFIFHPRYFLWRHLLSVTQKPVLSGTGSADVTQYFQTLQERLPDMLLGSHIGRLWIPLAYGLQNLAMLCHGFFRPLGGLQSATTQQKRGIGDGLQCANQVLVMCGTIN